MPPEAGVSAVSSVAVPVTWSVVTVALARLAFVAVIGVGGEMVDCGECGLDGGGEHAVDVL